jgi:hypothetical protein
VIVTLPKEIPVTTPLLDTTAMDGSLDDQVTGAPETTLPLASRGVADRLTVQFTFTLTGDGETVTVATDGAETFTVTTPL